MKQIFLFSCLLLSGAFNIVKSQDYKIPVQNSKEGKLSLENFPGDLPIEGYSGSDIVISSDQKAEVPERAKGLKAIYADGTDNTGVAVYMEKNGNQVTLTCLLPITQSANYKIKVPDNFMVDINNECGHSGDVTVSNLKSEIDVTNCQSITLKNVSGPLVLSTISGDIDVSFTEVKKENPIAITSISGDINVTMPATAGVDIQLENTSGSTYSDFDFPSDDKKLRKIGGNSIKSQLNGGGASMKLTNISGNIYLRKKA